ncbi:MAG: hypothetical protein ABSH21_12700 [Verrucomicrobiia bacterium]|jgi:hypothetical protein
MCGSRRNPTTVLALVLFAASLVVGTLAPPGPQAESAITAWWKLDEGTGTNVLDSFLNGRDGVLEGNKPSSAWTTGVLSNAVTLCKSAS